MKAHSGLLLAVTGLVLLPSTGCIIIADGGWYGGPPSVWTEPVTERIAITTEGLKAVEVRTHNGSINYVGQEAAAEAYVVVTKKGGARTAAGAVEALGAFEVYAEQRGDGTLEIGSRWLGTRKRGWRKAASFEVHAPSTAGVYAKTHNGPVRLANVTNEVRIVTHNGGVDVDSSDGRLFAETHNGHIHATYTGPEITLNTHNGSVTADLARCTAVDGEITTHNGGVRLVLAETVSTRLIARTHNGSVRCALPLAQLEASRRRLKGTIGDGTGRLVVTTHNGSVRVKDAAG